ncbi:TPA: hypothetical protein N0F65_008550 [Lagenidium giganteum]|uniref:Steroid 5-alpha reductase C-terminal domain-containing protein n=1 Tax=Lagenidium giganteum TaxID=4803 RepID=A0AAV2YPW8_9STRA|nr:TPA: hypothetical protein N0F65_008550 [Lagenidium giganteum]
MKWQVLWQHVVDAAHEAAQAPPSNFSALSALAGSLRILAAVIVICWLASVVTRNYSHVDRIWSIIPFVYVWHFAIKAWTQDGAWSDRLVLMTALATLWGLRLTFNFWRKGGYSLSEEDYRWAVLRQHMHWVLYQIFNVIFIAAYQNVLLYLIAFPAYAAYLNRSVPLQPLDWVAAALFVFFLVLETVADQQQWVFYQNKYARLRAKQPLEGDAKAGFNRSGLFRYSRHPNFFAEQLIWCSFYLFSVAATGVLINGFGLGAALLVLLFQGSTEFTEYITARKYPEYKAYQKAVSRLVPWFPSSVKAHEE